MEKYDVIVVGAGSGGTACSALLAKWGLKVLLLDKNSQVGGKAKSCWPMRSIAFVAATIGYRTLSRTKS